MIETGQIREDGLGVRFRVVARHEVHNGVWHIQQVHGVGTSLTCPSFVLNAWKLIVDKEAAMPVDDATWLLERGEDAASLRALVEAVDAGYEKLVGEDPRKIDSRAKVVDNFVGRLAEDEYEIALVSSLYDAFVQVGGTGALAHKDYAATVRALVDHARELEAHVAELEDSVDPDEDDVEDVPLGGLSHEDAHFVLSGVRTAADNLDAGQAWPDDAKKAARYLRGLLK